MPTKRYALIQGEPKDLEVRWHLLQRQIKLSYLGKELFAGSLADPRLQQGLTLVLAEGKELLIKQQRQGIFAELELSFQGKPLPGSDSDPERKIAAGWSLLYLIGFFNLLFGFLAVVVKLSFLQNLGVNSYALVLGILYIVLAFFTQKGHALALLVGMLLYLGDGTLSLYLAVSTKAGIPYGGLVVRLLFLLFMYRAFRAFSQLRKK